MVKVVEHPLIKVKLAIMRDEKTVSKEFRESLDEIASLMCFEVFKDIGTHEIEETFNITFDSSDLTFENMETIKDLINLIKKTLAYESI